MPEGTMLLNRIANNFAKDEGKVAVGGAGAPPAEAPVGGAGGGIGVIPAPSIIGDYTIIASKMVQAFNDAVTAGTPFNVTDWIEKNPEAKHSIFRIGFRQIMARMGTDWKVSDRSHWYVFRDIEIGMKTIMSIINTPGVISTEEFRDMIESYMVEATSGSAWREHNISEHYTMIATATQAAANVAKVDAPFNMSEYIHSTQSGIGNSNVTAFDYINRSDSHGHTNNWEMNDMDFAAHFEVVKAAMTSMFESSKMAHVIIKMDDQMAIAKGIVDATAQIEKFTAASVIAKAKAAAYFAAQTAPK